MIQISDKTKCCGCTACASVCPKKCITMQYDEEGFLYPVVDKTSCVNCGICEKACPFNKIDKFDEHCSVYVALQNVNEKERNESTAGGAFSLIADALINGGAVIWAAGYDSSIRVIHKCADNKDSLSELRGSKYVQSYLGDTFRQIQSDLKKGLTVLFVGTPCQVHGLKRIMGNAQNLYTMDLLCLGVSSPKLFSKYIEYLSEKYRSRVKSVSFRDKHYGYATPNVRVDFENGRYIQQIYDSKVHANLFFSHYNVRPCCYQCEFRECPRVSDFTIGDFNDVGNFIPSMDDNKGTTRVWIHTDKGKALMEEVKKSAKVVILDNSSSNVVGGSRKQIVRPSRREEFFQDSTRFSYSDLVGKWQPYQIKGTIISVIRNIINPFPFRDALTKAIRLKKVSKFNKNVAKLNNKDEERK